MDDSEQSDAVTTITLQVPSCTLLRRDLVELARPIEAVAGHQDWKRPRFEIEGRDRTLTCRSLKALEESSWPRDVKGLRFSADGEAGKEITFWASVDTEYPQKIKVSGRDALWVQGVAEHYRNMLSDRKNWHWLPNKILVLMLLAPLGAPWWVPRLFPYIEVDSGTISRAAVLRRRVASAVGILVLLALAVVGNILYNLLT